MEYESGGEEGDPGEGWDTGSRNEARTHRTSPELKGTWPCFLSQRTKKGSRSRKVGGLLSAQKRLAEWRGALGLRLGERLGSES